MCTRCSRCTYVYRIDVRIRVDRVDGCTSIGERVTEQYIFHLVSNIDPHIPLHILSKKRKTIHLNTEKENYKKNIMLSSKNNLDPFIRQNTKPHESSQSVRAVKGDLDSFST